MRNLLNKYLTGASLIALTFSLNTSTANATCSAMPTCEELGYTQTSCNGGSSIKCPFDTTKLRCTSCTGHYNLVDGRCEDWECGVGQAQKFSTTCPNAYCPYRCYCGKSEYCYVVSTSNEDSCISEGYVSSGNDCIGEASDVILCPYSTDVPYCLAQCPPSCNFDDCKFYKKSNGHCVEATCQELGYTVAYADVPENLREGLNASCICDYSNGYAPDMAAWVKPSCKGQDECPSDYIDISAIPDSIKNNPIYNLSQVCPTNGNKVKISCNLGTFWYGTCDLSSFNLPVGSDVDCKNGSIGYVTNKGENYVDIVINTKLGGTLGFAPLYGTDSYEGITLHDSAEEAMMDMNGYETYNLMLDWAQIHGMYDPDFPSSDGIEGGYLYTVNKDMVCPALSMGEWFVPSAGQLNSFKEITHQTNLADSGKVVVSSTLLGNGNFWSYDRTDGNERFQHNSYTSSGRVQLIPAVRIKF